MSKTTETWRDIPAHPNYEASDQGNIRHIGSKVNRSFVIDSFGSPFLRMGNKCIKIKKLIEAAFFPYIKQGQHLYPLNGNKQDLRLSNLRAMSQSEFSRMRSKTARPMATPVKLDDIKVHHMYKSGMSMNAIAKHFGVGCCSISRCLKRPIRK